MVIDMKKRIFGSAIVAIVGLLAVSCSSTNLETNKVGWSSYTEITGKDFDVVKIVKVSSTEKVTKSFFYTKVDGSRVLYAQLMDEAAKAGADDIINVRIDKKHEDSNTSTTTIYTYTATALAIKYKDTTATSWKTDTPTNSVREGNPGAPVKKGFFTKLIGLFKFSKK